MTDKITSAIFFVAETLLLGPRPNLRTRRKVLKVYRKSTWKFLITAYDVSCYQPHGGYHAVMLFDSFLARRNRVFTFRGEEFALNLIVVSYIFMLLLQ